MLAQLSALAKQLPGARARADDGAGPTDLTGSGVQLQKGKAADARYSAAPTPLFPSPHHRDGSGSGVCPAAWHRHRAQLPCQPARCRTDVLPAGKALDAANRPCGPFCSAVDPCGRHMPNGPVWDLPVCAAWKPGRASQLFSCQCTPNSLQRQLLPCRQPASGGISPLLSLKNRFIPHPLLIVRVEENGIFQKNFGKTLWTESSPLCIVIIYVVNMRVTQFSR